MTKGGAGPLRACAEHLTVLRLCIGRNLLYAFRTNFTFIATSIFLIFALSGCAKEPTTYEDCILQKLTKPATKSASEAIIEACRLKFPEKIVQQEKPEVLPDSDVAKLHGKFKAGTNASFGNLYNGTYNWEISEITIMIGHRNETTKQFVGDAYTVKVESPPLSSTPFSLGTNTVESKKYQWIIIGAKGNRVVE